LRIVREICRFLGKQASATSSLDDLSSWVVRVAYLLFRRHWKRSRVYHYTSAAEEFGLIVKPDVHTVSLTPRGARLVALCSGDSDPASPLSGREKRALGHLLCRCGGLSCHLAFYMPTGRPPGSMSEFRRYAGAIRITRHDAKEYLLTTASGKSVCLSRAQKASHVWTLHGWLRALDMVDDLYEEDAASFLTLRREVRVFYPIRTKSFTTQELRLLLAERAEANPACHGFLYIPELLVDVCVSRGIPRELFFARLLDLHRDDPIHCQLSMMSYLRSDPRRLQHYRYANFPEVDGVLRSHVCLRLDAAEEDHGQHTRRPNTAPARR
jgi:hypothetical protein